MRQIEQPSSSETSFLQKEAQHQSDSVSKVLDNERLVQVAFAKSTSKGFEALFRIYFQALFSHAVRFVYTKEKAEDIVCDVFLDFWKSNSFMHMEGSYRAYLYAAVRNRAYTYIRYELKNEKKMMSSESMEHLSEAINPESIIEYDELHHRVDKAIHELPAQCQRVFLLSRFEGLKNREIASELNLSVKTVEAHLAKALTQLKKAVLLLVALSMLIA